ncbi:MAG: hypothetical protein J1E37_03280 [Prevotella sp.]|nr:hypothetical protein [Prevotella sp.]
MDLSFRHKSPFYLYTALWLIYLLQGVIFGGETIIAKLLLVVLLAWSACHFLHAATHHMPSPLAVLTILLVSYVLYGLVPIVNNEVGHIGLDRVSVPPFSYMKAALSSILPAYTYYHFAKRGMINGRDIRVLAVVFLPLIILDYYHNEQQILAKALSEGIDREEITNNVGYEFLCLFPYLYFLKRKYALPFMVCLVVFLLMAMKRGAILIGTLCTILYLYNWLRYAKRQTKIYAFAGIIAIAIGIGLFVSDMYENSPYFQHRIESTLEGNTSGRDEIVSHLLDEYTNKGSTVNLLFGFGANGTLKHGGRYAHSDWVEMLIDQGAIGVFILLSFYVSLFLFLCRTRRRNAVKNAALMLFIIMSAKTVFSMSICAMLPYTTLLLGYSIWQISKK